MKNKKILIISLIIVILIAVITTIIKPLYYSNVFENIGKDEMIEHLKNIDNYEQKQKEINEVVEKGWITEKEANKIR